MVVPFYSFIKYDDGCSYWKTKAEALELAEIFSLMIQGDHKDEDKLGEAEASWRGFLNFHNVSNVQRSLGMPLKRL